MRKGVKNVSEFVIKGEKKLNGEVKISGSKNAALPIIAASLLNSNKVTLYNVPNIEDVNTTLKILRVLGCKVARKCGKIELLCDEIKSTEIPKDLMKKSRSTVIIAGALIGRFKKATFSYPGGCNIGSRPIDLHISAFTDLGINVEENENRIECNANEIQGNKIYLKFPSVGATENTILASVLADGQITEIYNAAKEPEIKDLATFLNKSGARIYGAGKSKIKIVGVKSLKKVNYRIMPDRIETGTFLCMAANTKGKVKLNNTNPLDLIDVLYKLKKTGCKIYFNNNSITLFTNKRLKPINLSTEIYPGFPTDLQPIFTAILCKTDGKSTIQENIFENRFGFCDELNKMGAQIKRCDEKQSNLQANEKAKEKILKDQVKDCIIINGVKELKGTNVYCKDLRGGASLITAALGAKGTTVVKNAENVLRGYENIDKKLQSLGADIKFVK